MWLLSEWLGSIRSDLTKNLKNIHFEKSFFFFFFLLKIGQKPTGPATRNKESISDGLMRNMISICNSLTIDYHCYWTQQWLLNNNFWVKFEIVANFLIPYYPLHPNMLLGTQSQCMCKMSKTSHMLTHVTPYFKKVQEAHIQVHFPMKFQLISHWSFNRVRGFRPIRISGMNPEVVVICNSTLSRIFQEIFQLTH